MKLTRSAFVAGLGVLIVSAGVSMATPGNGQGGGNGGNGGGRGNSKKKVVVNGTVTSVDGEAGTFVLHRSGGRANGRNGSDVTVVVDPETTVFLRSDEGEFSSDDLAVGAKAQAKGKLDAEGDLLATRVLIKVAEETEE